MPNFFNLNVDFGLGGEFSLKRSSNDHEKFGDEDRTKKVWKTKKKGKNVVGKSDKSDDFESEWGSLSGDGITGKLPRRVNRITLKVNI